MKAFIFNDNLNFLDTISKYISQAGYESVCFSNKKNSLLSARTIKFDLYIISLLNNNAKGIEIFNTVCKNFQNVNFILIIPYYNARYFIKQYKLAEHEYILAPFTTQEMEIKIDAKQLSIQNIIKLSDTYSYDVNKSILLKDNKNVYLPRLAHMLIKLLVGKLNIVVSKDEIKKYIWGNTDIPSRAVLCLVNRTRYALKDDFIETVKGEGHIIVGGKN